MIAENSKNRFFLKVYKYYIQYRNLKRLNKDENNISQSLEYYEDCIQKMTNDLTREYYSHGLILFKNKIKSRSLLKVKVKLILDYTEKDRTLFMKYWDSLEAACTLQDKINGLLSRLTNATITLTTHQRNRFRMILENKSHLLTPLNQSEISNNIDKISNEIEEAIKSEKQNIINSKNKIDSLIGEIDDIKQKYFPLINQKRKVEINTINHELLEIRGRVSEMEYIDDDLIFIKSKLKKQISEIESMKFRSDVFELNKGATVKLVESAGKYLNSQSAYSDKIDTINNNITVLGTESIKKGNDLLIKMKDEVIKDLYLK